MKEALGPMALVLAENWLNDNAGLLAGVFSFLGTLLGFIIAWRASWKSIAEMRKAEAAEWRRKFEESEKENGVLRRDYHQTLEFNLQDRETKDLLADEIMRLAPLAREDSAQILHQIRLDVMAGANRRRLLGTIHTTVDATGGSD